MFIASPKLILVSTLMKIKATITSFGAIPLSAIFTVSTLVMMAMESAKSIAILWKACGTDVRNFLRPFKTVHKKYLASYVAMTEFKRISPNFIAALVSFHTFPI